MVCPWNERFAAQEGDPALAPRRGDPFPDLATELALTPEEFQQEIQRQPDQTRQTEGVLEKCRSCPGKHRQMKNRFLRSKSSSQDDEPLIREHIKWAMDKIRRKRMTSMPKLLIATENKGKMRELQELLSDTAGD